MTAPIKIASKGSTFSFGASGSLVAIAQVLSLDLSGVETETFDGTTLDQSGTAKVLIPTGYYSKGEVSGEGFFDVNGMAGLIAFSTATPIVAAACSLTAGSGSVSVLASTTVAAVSYDVKVAMNDGVKMSWKCTLSG